MVRYRPQNNQLDNLNSVIVKHNGKVKNHTEEVKSAKEVLELHSIAIAINQQDFKKLDKDFTDAELQEKNSLNSLTTNKAEIDKLERESSKISGAIQRINRHLTDFFGKEEITLDLDESKKGYVIYRNGQIANNLSEGEKTAIAFSYFIVKVEEKGFQIKDGIIFIDDPISSFDSNFIYHCFTLINEHFKDAGQLFISTHNFHFFNLVKEWFTHKNTKVKEDNEKLSRENKSLKPIPCEFYMIENYIDQKRRNAKIILLDKTLKKFKSEYHFLFSRLNDFLKTNPNYADFYSIGNVARRYFEIFADFKIPNSSNQKQKIEAIVKEVNTEKVLITSVECGKVYKLINEFSHNYNPISAIEHTDKSECMDAIKILIKIVKYSDPKHFEILEKNCL